MQIVQPESVGLSSARLERVNRAMQAYIDQKKFGGIITLIARHGKVAHLEKFGWQEIETRRPMAFDTIFRIYSMTKPITSTAAMMLIEEGKIHLADPVSRYIPAFKDARVMVSRGGGGDYDLVPAAREMTVLDLFTHTAGLSYSFEEHSALDDLYRKEFWGPLDQKPDATLAEVILELAKLPLANHPGRVFRYSTAIDVLGYIVQLAAGQPLADFFQERIFTPLGMVDTAFWVPPAKADRLAQVYEPAEHGGLQPIASPMVMHYTRPNRWASGGGGLVSTVDDYFRFGQMLLDQGIFEGTRLLGRKTVEWMLQNHLPDGVSGNEPYNGFGLGGAVLIKPGLSDRPGSLGKFGWGGAANTEWWIDPLEDLHCILMTQYMPPFTLPLVEDFAQTAYQALE